MAIDTSFFEFLKIGPGPSSSHTIGPMKAGYDFISAVGNIAAADLSTAVSIDVTLYGSLAATGKGHGTDRAILAGLLGRHPEACPSEFLDTLSLGGKDIFHLPLPGKEMPFKSTNIVFSKDSCDSPFSNTMVMRLSGKNGVVLLEKEYYSIGGGFIQWKGWEPPEKGAPVYAYSNTVELQKQLKKHRLTLPELMMRNEQAITGADEETIKRKLDAVVAVMQDSVKRGLATEGYLPGPIGLHRKASILWQRAKKMGKSADRFMISMCAYAFAASEENAAGHIVVTAPTCGSAGVVPSIVRMMSHHHKHNQNAIRDALIAAIAIGFIAKHNASISGAEVGCQGEIGVASSMAAALLAYAGGAPFEIAENAAETALEQHMGMTCDPVKGYVQIPCIERNAMGAVKAYVSYLIAAGGIPEWHVVNFDKAVKAMSLTGRDMSAKYKETSEGGLAQCC